MLHISKSRSDLRLSVKKLRYILECATISPMMYEYYITAEMKKSDQKFKVNRLGHVERCEQKGNSIGYLECSNRL